MQYKFQAIRKKEIQEGKRNRKRKWKGLGRVTQRERERERERERDWERERGGDRERMSERKKRKGGGARDRGGTNRLFTLKKHSACLKLVFMVHVMFVHFETKCLFCNT